MDTKQLLLELSGLDGVSGRENAVAARLTDLLAPYGMVSTTPLGSVLCAVREPQPGQAHLLLDAHMDEIGLVVTQIGDDGFLRVGPCGGMDRRVLAAAPVAVHTASGAIDGVVCSVPPHLAGDDEKINPKVEDLYIDIGLDGEAARKSVSPGDVVTMHSEPLALLGGLVSGKALDDRAGCIAHLVALDALGGIPLDCGLTVLFSSMEEVGCIGAKSAAYQVGPTHAVAVDVSYAHTPDSRREKCGELGGGPMVGFAPILHAAMSRDLVETAKRCDIPFQLEVMGGKTGTNADNIATARGGVMTALLSVPLRYMHTPVETVSVEDVENTGRLIAAFIADKWGVRA